MNTLATYDVIVVGGGPAGSSCASVLVKSGVHTLLLDRATFPRVKLCAGWLSAPIWNVLEISPKSYPLGLWEWDCVHIHFRGKKYNVKSNGYFVRRVEFDDFLLKRSGVEVKEGYMVRHIQKDADGFWVIDNQYRAKYLVGAGGSHCPVARALFPKEENLQCGTQEKEFEGRLEEIAACRAGKDGEPEILLHDDLKGYSWNVPKGSWLNIGTGTKAPREVVPAWLKAKSFFEGNGTGGTIPLSCRPLLDKMKGHGYITFQLQHLKAIQADNAFIVGDAVGLAQPMTGEGILPAVLSGKLCGQAIAEGAPDTYQKRLRTHPIISDYRVIHSVQTTGKKILSGKGKSEYKPSAMRDKIIINLFAMLFSGKPLPGSSIIAKMRS